MTVMFTVLVAFIFYGERIGSRQTIGIVAGFVGVVVLASGKTAGGSVWAAALAGTSAALFYGFGVNLIRRHLTGIPASAVAAATLLGASLVLAPFAIWSWPDHAMQSQVVGERGTARCAVHGYRVRPVLSPDQSDRGTTCAAMVTYLIPLFAVLWAWLVLAEALTPAMAVSAALILGGVALSQQQRGVKANKG